MSKPIIKPCLVPSRSELHQAIHGRVLEVVKELLDAELTAFLGTEAYERSADRRGYRHGAESRRLTTEYGRVEVKVPRGRVQQPDGTTKEFQGTVLPRYARRTRRVDEAILGAYLAGANTRCNLPQYSPLPWHSSLRDRSSVLAQRYVTERSRVAVSFS